MSSDVHAPRPRRGGPIKTRHELIKSPNAFRLLERLGTNTQVYYISRREWVRKLGDNYLKSE